MANEFDELERKLFGSAPAPQAAAPQKTTSESNLFGGSPIPKTQPQQTAPRSTQQAVPQPDTMLGRIRETMQAASPLPTLSMGLTDYVPAMMRRGVSAMGLGPQQDVGKSVFDLKKQEQAQREAIEARHPYASTVGTVGGLAGGIALTPNVSVPRALEALPYIGKTLSPTLTGGVYSGVGSLGETGSVSEAAKDAARGAVMGGVLSPIVEKAIGRFAARPAPAGGPRTAEELAYETLQKAGISTPSRGVVTGDPKQLARERTYGADIYGKMAQQAGETAQTLYGAPQMLPAQAAEEAVTRARTKALSEKAAADAAYRQAKQVRGAFDLDRLQNIGANILNDFSLNSQTAGFAATGAARKAARELDSIVGARVPVSDNVNLIHRDFNIVESGRQALNRQLSAAQDNVERVAVRNMIDKFDDHIERAINEGAFSGDPDALSKWQNARKLWSQYQDKYGIKKTGSDAGSLMKTIIDENTDPVRVADMIFSGGMSPDATMKKTAISVFNQLKRGLGSPGQRINEVPELVKIKQSFMQNLMTPAGATPSDFAKTAKQIDNFLTGPTRGLARTMLEGREAEALRNISDAMKIMARGGQVPDSQKISKLALAVDIAGPVIGGITMGMINSHPAFYGVGAAMGSLVPVIHAYGRSGYRQSRLANRPYRPTSPTLPGAYTVVPRATMEEEPPQQADGGRVARASGGRIDIETGVRALMNAAENAKKSISKTTENLLKQPDEHIAQALNVAKRHI